jgi:hypothetical protein
VDRRKLVISKRKSWFDAIRALGKKEGARTTSKILQGIYGKGWTANQKGQDRDTNPYPPESPYRAEWNQGWIECSKIIKRRQSDIFERRSPGRGILSQPQH